MSVSSAAPIAQLASRLCEAGDESGSTDEAKAKSKAKSGSLIERFTDLKSLLPRKPAGAKAK